MLKRIIILSCLFTYVSIGQNIDKFFLIAEGGEKLGPFSFADGQKITVPKGEYTVQLLDTSVMAQKLRATVLPRIHFEYASLNQVVRYLNDKSRELDPEGKGIEINFRDKSKAEQVEKNSDSPKPDSNDWGVSKTASNWPPPRQKHIDLRMTDVSIAECLTNICKQTDTNWLIENGRVIIER